LGIVDLLSPIRPRLRLGALLQGVGIPGGPVEAEAENARGRERAAALLTRGRYSNQEIQEVSELVGMGLEPPLNLTDPASRRRWLSRADPEKLRSFGRIWLAKARWDRRLKGKDPTPVVDLLEAMRREVRSGSPLRVSELALDGRDLIAMGFKPGPRFGDILDSLMDQVLENPSLNTKEILRDRAGRLWTEEETS
jgi:tRNA nucleotidyltransferase (CCA-adding enzyme)